jgi:hypothetical protein
VNTFHPFSTLPPEHTQAILDLFRVNYVGSWNTVAVTYLRERPELMQTLADAGLDPSYFCYALEYVICRETAIPDEGIT